MAHPPLKIPTTPSELLQSWRHRIRLNQKAHYAMVHRAERRAFWFGVISAVISGIVGVLILVTEKGEAPPWLRVAAGAVSILASVITAIATSGKWSEKAAQHHAAGAAYGNLHRRIEHVLAVPPSSDEAMNGLLEELRYEQDSIPMNAPPIPDKVWKALPQELSPSMYEAPASRALQAPASSP